MTRGRPMTPLGVAFANGRTEVNPARYTDRVQHTGAPLGPPPNNAPEGVIRWWDYYAQHLHWLTAKHRGPFLVYCEALSHVDECLETGRPIWDQLANRVRQYSAMFGTDPSSEQKMPAKPDEDDGEF